ncbi:MAG: tetratricopeptide repeat protein [Proteobacteria bacterium]|nr:tetratricopeptide repeat protein [Pseudomonadota bacterium]MBU1714928.1 tetratricopeptide repeat protein [Pseudomonadota bacterium]
MKPLAEMNFLIVDDIDNMRRSIRAMLKLINYGRRYYEAANGREAWKLLEEGEFTPDFIISDYNMPQMSGTELLAQIRASKKFRDIPFLMITAEANMEVVAEAAEHDVDAYMTKPFVTASLEQKINELLEKANNPDPVTVHLQNLRELREKGDIDGAIVEAKLAIKANNISSRPYRELGRLYLKKGDLDNGLTCFQKATEINRLDVVSYHYLGQIYHRMGQTDKAINNFAKAMEISPRHYDRAINFADLLIKQKKIKEAEKVLKLVLRNNADNIEIKETVADSCYQNGLYDLAAKAFREIIKQDPERSYLNKKLGIALHRKGENNEATQVMEKIADKVGDDQELFLALAKSYFEMKIPIRADKWATKVIRIDPTNQEAREILNNCF